MTGKGAKKLKQWAGRTGLQYVPDAPSWRPLLSQIAGGPVSALPAATGMVDDLTVTVALVQDQPGIPGLVFAACLLPAAVPTLVLRPRPGVRVEGDQPPAFEHAYDLWAPDPSSAARLLRPPLTDGLLGIPDTAVAASGQWVGNWRPGAFDVQTLTLAMTSGMWLAQEFGKALALP
jgi:hypothetical protein